MGLGLTASSRLKRSLFGLGGYGGDKMLQNLANEALAYCTSQGIEAVYQGHVDNKMWYLAFHPAEEPVRFHTDYGEVMVEARTSSAGPGYHAFVVGFLDHCQKALGLNWTIDDETGYADSRDFSSLRAAMTEQLRVTAELLHSPDLAGAENFALSLPMDFNLTGNYGVASPLGLWDRAFFDNPDAAAWYPWWDYGVTAEAVHRMALCQLWMNVPWHPARDDDEAKVLVRASRLAARAAEMGYPLDQEDRADLATLMDGQELAEPGQAGRIGFWRRPRRWLVADGCSLVMPGYVYRTYRPERNSLTLVYGERATHLSTYVTENADALDALPWPDLSGREEHMRLEADDFRAVVVLEDTEENGAPALALHGFFRGYGRMVLVTVAFRHAGEIPWAEDVMRSVKLETPAEV